MEWRFLDTRIGGVLGVITEVDRSKWKQLFRRALINGAPLSGKTTSLKTWPAIAPGKRHILVAPGELGHSSILPDDDTKLYYWEFDPSASAIQYKKVFLELQQVTNDILSGKYGEVTSFAFDGLHKLYYVVMKANGFTPDSEAKEYTRYHEGFTQYISPILGSNVPYVAMTCYDGNEAIEVGSKTMQVFPDLPGRMAKQIMGMFPIILHSERSGEGPTQKFTWRLRASGKVQAAGMHVPKEIADKFPAELPQSWAEVEKIIASVDAVP